ncbi:MAG: hypothetical protein AB7W59_08520, partial [Acidimicrobiia bacterium]
LRDLRSVVVAADGAARDDEARALAGQLRDALNRRVDEEHGKWLAELQELVNDGRVVGALRRSSRPPKAGAPLPAELAAALAQQTSEALSADVLPDRWAVVLDALSFSPVRTSVTPVSVPEEKPEELLAAVRKAASRLPAIAALFGIEADAAVAPTGRGPRRPRPAGRPAGAPAAAGRPAPGAGGGPASEQAAPPAAEAAAPTTDDAASTADATAADNAPAAEEAPAPVSADTPVSEDAPATEAAEATATDAPTDAPAAEAEAEAVPDQN